jgi:hypothetical protein
MRDTIDNREAIEMMTRCKQEIAGLQAEISRLKPKADAYDNIATVLRLLPQPSIGAGEDLLWVLDRRIQELKSKPTDGRDDSATHR